MNNSILLSNYVADTMAIVIRIEKRKLGQQAKTIFEAAEQQSVNIFVPAIVFAEVLYLSERRKIGCSLESIELYFQQHTSIQELPMSFSVVQFCAKINDISELYDRLIAATDLSINVLLITNDPVIQSSQFIATVW